METQPQSILVGSPPRDTNPNLRRKSRAGFITPDKRFLPAEKLQGRTRHGKNAARAALAFPDDVSTNVFVNDGQGNLGRFLQAVFVSESSLTEELNPRSRSDMSADGAAVGRTYKKALELMRKDIKLMKSLKQSPTMASYATPGRKQRQEVRYMFGWHERQTLGTILADEPVMASTTALRLETLMPESQHLSAFSRDVLSRLLHAYTTLESGEAADGHAVRHACTIAPVLQSLQTVHALGRQDDATESQHDSTGEQDSLGEDAASQPSGGASSSASVLARADAGEGGSVVRQSHAIAARLLTPASFARRHVPAAVAMLVCEHLVALDAGALHTQGIVGSAPLASVGLGDQTEAGAGPNEQHDPPLSECMLQQEGRSGEAHALALSPMDAAALVAALLNRLLSARGVTVTAQTEAGASADSAGASADSAGALRLCAALLPLAVSRSTHAGGSASTLVDDGSSRGPPSSLSSLRKSTLTLTTLLMLLSWHRAGVACAGVVPPQILRPPQDPLTGSLRGVVRRLVDACGSMLVSVSTSMLVAGGFALAGATRTASGEVLSAQALWMRGTLAEPFGGTLRRTVLQLYDRSGIPLPAELEVPGAGLFGSSSRDMDEEAEEDVEEDEENDADATGKVLARLARAAVRQKRARSEEGGAGSGAPARILTTQPSSSGHRRSARPFKRRRCLASEMHDQVLAKMNESVQKGSVHGAGLTVSLSEPPLSLSGFSVSRALTASAPAAHGPTSFLAPSTPASAARMTCDPLAAMLAQANSRRRQGRAESSITRPTASKSVQMPQGRGSMSTSVRGRWFPGTAAS